jgi:hypothetical protein
MTHEPKFKVGQHVRYSYINSGHDKELLLTKGAKVLQFYKGTCPRTTSYLLEGYTSIHPETRLV